MTLKIQNHIKISIPRLTKDDASLIPIPSPRTHTEPPKEKKNCVLTLEGL